MSVERRGARGHPTMEWATSGRPHYHIASTEEELPATRSYTLLPRNYKYTLILRPFKTLLLLLAITH